VQDLFHIALAEHSAIASFGRRTVLAAMALAAVVALAGVTLDATILPGHDEAIQRFVTFERSMNFVILILLLLISILLLWFPIKVRKKLAIYISGFVLFASTRSFGLLLVNLLPQAATIAVSTIMLALTLLCLVIWMVGIGRRASGPLLRRVTGAIRKPCCGSPASWTLSTPRSPALSVAGHRKEPVVCDCFHYK